MPFWLKPDWCESWSRDAVQFGDTPPKGCNRSDEMMLPGLAALLVLTSASAGEVELATDIAEAFAALSAGFTETSDDEIAR